MGVALVPNTDEDTVSDAEDGRSPVAETDAAVESASALQVREPLAHRSEEVNEQRPAGWPVYRGRAWPILAILSCSTLAFLLVLIALGI